MRALLAFCPCILLAAIRYLIPTPLPAFLVFFRKEIIPPHTRRCKFASTDMENVAVRCEARTSTYIFMSEHA